MATNLSLKYTDEQLNEALARATAQVGGLSIEGFSDETEWHPDEIDHLRAILDHLPDHQDDWQACAWADILPTDSRVKAEFIGGTVFEGVPDGIGDGGIYIVDGNFIPYSTDAKWYRIPAPVQHPDPAEHPVIIIYRPNGNGETPVSYAWTGQHYRSFDGQEYFSANEITDWSPAKVVADDE